jgi:hypothetical protein
MKNNGAIVATAFADRIRKRRIRLAGAAARELHFLGLQVVFQES